MDINKLFSVKGKVAIVTGGSRGIGYGISRGLVTNGAKVYITARKAQEALKAAEELTKLGPGECIAFPADVSKEEGCKQLYSKVSEREKKIHILVNNAGATWGAPLEEYPDSAWTKLNDVNVKGVFQMTQVFLPMLEAAGCHEDPARVINIGSIDGVHIPMMETFAYTATKAAVHQLTRVMASHLGPRHITVNAIAAGPFESKMMAATLDQFKDALVATVPLGRIGSPEDLAGLSLYLCSRAGAYTTGAVIPLDGGILVGRSRM